MPTIDPPKKTTIATGTISRTKIAVAVGLCGLAIIAAFATGTIQKSTNKLKLKPAQASSIAPSGCQFLEAGKSQETVNQALKLGCQSKICATAKPVYGSLWSKKTTKKTDNFNLYCIKLACKDKPAETIQCKVYKK